MKVEVDTPFGKKLIEVRFVIKNEAGAYFTEMTADGARDVIANGAVVCVEQLYRPQFESSAPRFASQFDTTEDAESVMSNSQFGGPGSFAGCVVVPSEQ